MSECCSSENTAESQFPRKYRCPSHQQECKEVSIKTILHHVKEPWNWNAKQQGYYFCDNPDCDVVYFGQDDSVILTSELRTLIGIKNLKDTTKNALMCYCFGVDIQTAMSSSEAKAFVVRKTKEQTCECAIRNPSGRCCLKDFKLYF